MCVCACIKMHGNKKENVDNDGNIFTSFISQKLIRENENKTHRRYSFGDITEII